MSPDRTDFTRASNGMVDESKGNKTAGKEERKKRKGILLLYNWRREREGEMEVRGKREEVVMVDS